MLRGFLQLRLKGCDKLLCRTGQPDLLAVGRQSLQTLLPREQLPSVIIKGLRPQHAKIPGAQLASQVGEHADFQVAAVGWWTLAGGAAHDLAPTFRGKREIDMFIDPLAMQILVVLDELKGLNQCAVLRGRLQLQKVTQAKQQRAMRFEMFPDQG
ncbi:hypothetical protein D9M72_404500 [compost metagenome]